MLLVFEREDSLSLERTRPREGNVIPKVTQDAFSKMTSWGSYPRVHRCLKVPRMGQRVPEYKVVKLCIFLLGKVSKVFI